MPSRAELRAIVPSLLFGVVALFVEPLVAPLAAQLAPPVSGARAVFVGGQAQVVPAFNTPAAWVREHLWVETEFDSDGDGQRDRMHVDVTRPRQTATEGLRVPVVYESSPYFAGTSGARRSLWNVEHEVGAEPPVRVPQSEVPFKANRLRVSTSEVATWVPRGFAVVHSEAPGTGLSQGCPTIGDAPERLAPKAVIDWLNGRAKGYTTASGTDEVKAFWSTGKVGMTGTSYNGTLSLAAAVTGVPGLEAIIPVAPNTSYYHYYRSNGLVRHPGGWLGEDVDFLFDFVHSGDPDARAYCRRVYRDSVMAGGRDRRSGDFNAFWAVRDLLPLVPQVHAATLLSHGLNDWNVMPEHSVRIYDALRKQGTPAMLYLHQGGHGGPPPLDLQNRWFSRFLYDVANGIERESTLRVMRENAPHTSRPAEYAAFPNPAAQPVTLYPQRGGQSVGMLSLGAAARAHERFVDDVRVSGARNASLPAATSRLLYATPVFRDSVHLSGTPTLTISVAASKSAANLSVWLVTLPFDSTAIGSQGMIGVVTRGWADPQNAAALTRGGNFSTMTRGAPLEPGRFHSLTFDLQPDDQILPPGKQLGVMIMSSDRDFTVWPTAGTALTVDLAKTSLTLPVVGGAAALIPLFASRSR